MKIAISTSIIQEVQIVGAPVPPIGDRLLKEDSDAILLESGDNLLKEG